MGVVYGRVSGDPNAMHTTRMGARLFGHQKPFLQGFCTMNLVLKALTSAGHTIQDLTIQFIRKVETGQELEIRHGSGRYEVIGECGKVLAVGSLV